MRTSVLESVDVNDDFVAERSISFSDDVQRSVDINVYRLRIGQQHDNAVRVVFAHDHRNRISFNRKACGILFRCWDEG